MRPGCCPPGRPHSRAIRRTGGRWRGFTGWYYNKRLGSYRAFVTDPRRAVVLRYANRRVVLSPDAPEDFVRELGAPGL